MSNFQGEAGQEDPNWNAWPSWMSTCTGISYLQSLVGTAEIRDGTSNTSMLGEKHLSPDHYTVPTDPADNRTMHQGMDYDVNRFANENANTKPRQDTPGTLHNWAFGSAHSGGYNAALCDGSVRSISYSIDQSVHRRLANRMDGEVIDASQF